RRRHTRSLRDWSSDVCSSDLAEGIQVSHLPMLLDRSRTPNGMLVGHLAKPNPQWREFTGNGATVTASFAGPHAYISPRWYQTRRSEERRVGKECKSRWARYTS